MKFIEITDIEGEQFVQNISQIDCLKRENNPRFQHTFWIIFMDSDEEKLEISKGEYDRLKGILLEEREAR